MPGRPRSSLLPLCLLLALPLAAAGARGPGMEGQGRPPARNAAVTPGSLRVEYRTEPLGLDVPRPRLSWQVAAAERGAGQRAYQIRVATSEAALRRGSGLAWDSGRVPGEQVREAAYGGPPLASRQRYYWQVRVWDGRDRPSAWSAPGFWETGLLDAADWQAAWIGGRQQPDHDWSDARITFDFTFRPSAAAPPAPAAGGNPFGPPSDPEPNDVTPLHVLFRARPVGKTYGEAYVWQITCVDGRPMLRAKVRRYPGGSTADVALTTLKEVPLSHLAAEELLGKRHEVVIDAQGPRIRTWIDGVLVDAVVDGSQASGTVGFSTPAPDAAVVHRVSVEAGGRTVFRTAFEGGANPFTAGRPTPAGLQLSGGADGKDAVLPISTPAPLLRRPFDVNGRVRRARLYVAAGGFPKITLNGRGVGASALADGFTAYDRRVLYRTYDVTELLRQGGNVLGFELGRGWYGVTVPNEWYFHMAPWHAAPSVRAQLEVELAGGERQVVATDGSWRTTDGPTTDDSIYLGEKYDARLAPAGWDRPGFDDRRWAPAAVVPGPAGRPDAAEHEPVGVVGTIRPVAVATPRPGTFVFDFGRIFAGWVRLRVTGPAGQAVSLVHGEKLNPDGTVQVIGGLIDGQLQTDYYTLAGGGREEWEPSFGYKGFRYVQVEGYPGAPAPDALLGKIVHSAVDTTGRFESSNALLNRIQQAAQHTILNNLHGFQTDTPTYEKNGWTGDAHASSLAAGLNFGVASVWTKWMADFRDAQSEQGEIPEIVPSTPYYGYENTPGWSMIGGPVPSWDAAALVIPRDQHLLYGDARILEEMYDAQKRLVDYTGSYFPPDGYAYGNRNNVFLGEYAAPVSFAGGRPAFTAGPVDATASAYYYHMLDLLARSAEILGRAGDAAAYRSLAGKVRAAYNARYWDDAGRYYRATDAEGTAAPYSQTMNALPAAFGMVPDGHERAVVRRLNDVVVAGGYQLASAGVFAIRYLMTLLSDHGYVDTAFRVATRTDEPSWGWWIENGHSTMFEGWSLNSRSYDHHYFGSISSWFYQSLAGIRPGAPGYASLIVRPRVPAGLDRVSASLRTVRGVVSSGWTRAADGVFELQVTVPGGTPAEVWVPAAGPRASVEPEGAVFSRTEDGCAVYTVGAGTYVFRSVLP